jgi:uncharacterized protein YqhQ
MTKSSDSKNISNVKRKSYSDCSSNRVGGQAIIEGVMMRHRNKVAYAARKENGKIISEVRKINPASEKYLFLKLPFIRGTYSLVSSLLIGIGALMWSTNAQIEKKEEKISGKEMTITFIISFIFAILLFVMLPLFLTKLLVSGKGFLFNLIDGIIRVLVFVIYIFAISSMNDVKRLFKYHGAEHKAVFCYENKLSLTVKNAKKFSRLHPRCGTNFLVVVLVIMVFFHTFIYSDNFFVQFLFRLLLIPVIAGLSYEILMISAKYDNFITRAITNFGFLFQRLTTKEPDDKMIEVALVSLKKAVSK